MGRKNNSRKRPLPRLHHRHNDVQDKLNNTTTFFHPSMLAHQAAMMRNPSVHLGIKSAKINTHDDMKKIVEKKKQKEKTCQTTKFKGTNTPKSH